MALRKLDVRGAKCPIPIVKAKKEIDAMAPGRPARGDGRPTPARCPTSRAGSRPRKHALLKEQRTGKDETGRELYIHLLERK